MRTAEGVTFHLEHFGLGVSGDLELVGRWNGLDDPLQGDHVLVVNGAGRQERLVAKRASSRATHGERWSATFEFRGDPGEIEAAALQAGSDFVVDLPPPSANRRRFGRPVLSVRQFDKVSEASPADVSPLDLHAALIEAREETERVREELEVAREETARARRDAEREHERRQAEHTRMREALITARSLADEAVAAERAGGEQARVQLAAAQSELTDLREKQESAEQTLAALEARSREQQQRLQSELGAARQAGADAEQLRATLAELERTSAEDRVELDRLREHIGMVVGRLDEATGESRRLGEQADRLREAHEQATAESRRHAEEADRARRAHAEAASEMRRLDEEAERLREALAEAMTWEQEADRLRSALAAARAQATESDSLRSQLTASEAAAEAATAQIADLREELEGSQRAAQDAREQLGGAQRGAQQAHARAEALERRLAAVKRALEQ